LKALGPGINHDHLPSIARAKLPALYSSAKTALANCEHLDECKDWADKAEALASYAKQAQDDGLRKTADRIQARAIRRCGQLLSEIEGAVNQHKGASVGGGTSRNKAAREAGLSHRQQHTALRVARVNGEEFEDAVESEDPPTVTALAERGKKAAPKFDLHGRDPSQFAWATEALGWIRRAEDFCSHHDPKTIVDGMLPRELKLGAKISADALAVADWLRSLSKTIRRKEK